MSPGVEFRILGPVEVWKHGERHALDGAKQRTVLAALLLAGGRMISDGELSSLLWGENPPATVSAQLYTYVSRLRKLLDSDASIVRQRPGYLIRIGAARFDYVEFERLSRLGRSALQANRYREASRTLAQALTLWRGPALANVTEQLGAVELPSLEESRMVALEGRIEADLEVGRHRQLVAELTGLVAVYPLREQLRAQLMTALYRCDRQGDALGVYHDGRRVLAEELGVDPGPQLHRMYLEILANELPPEPAGQPQAPVAVGVRPETRPETLPPDVPDFTGRAVQLTRLCELLRAEQTTTPRCGVAVVTGPPGAGKTALALRAAHLCREQFPDGQLYADLGGIGAVPSDAADVLGSFLRALGVAELPADRGERIRRFRSLLANRRVLVVLDNAANDRQVRALLPAGVGCAVLVTSWTQLTTLEGADVVDLRPMAVDESLAMLTAIVGRPRVSAEPAEAVRLGELCGHLPLAIRIVGARLAQRPDLTLRRLASRLADDRHRLDRLRVGSLDVRARLEAGYRALDARARTALRRLALLDAPDFASWVVAAVLDVSEHIGEDVIDTLVNARLVEVSGGARYRLPELVRLVATERAVAEDPIGDRESALNRAFGAWLALACEVDRRLPDRVDWPRGGRAVRWRLAASLIDEIVIEPVAWFDGEIDALASVVRQAAATGRAAIAWELARAVAHYCDLRDRFELWRQTHQRAWTACRLAGDVRGQAAILLGLADLAGAVGDASAELSYGNHAAQLFEVLGEPARRAYALVHCGEACRKKGRYRESTDYAWLALTAIGALPGNQASEASAYASIGRVRRDQGAFASAAEFLCRAEEIWRELGHHGRVTAVVAELDSLATGETERAAV